MQKFNLVTSLTELNDITKDIDLTKSIDNFLQYDLKNDLGALKLSYILTKNFNSSSEIINFFKGGHKPSEAIKNINHVLLSLKLIKILPIYNKYLSYFNDLPNIPKSVLHYNERSENNRQAWVFSVIEKYYNVTKSSVRKEMILKIESDTKGKKEGIIIKQHSYQNFFAVNIFGLTEGCFDVGDNVLEGKQEGVLYHFNGLPTKDEIITFFEINDILKPSIKFRDDLKEMQAYDLQQIREFNNPLKN